jgi:hypothetical protein
MLGIISDFRRHTERHDALVFECCFRVNLERPHTLSMLVIVITHAVQRVAGRRYDLHPTI